MHMQYYAILFTSSVAPSYLRKYVSWQHLRLSLISEGHPSIKLSLLERAWPATSLASGQLAGSAHCFGLVFCRLLECATMLCDVRCLPDPGGAQQLPYGQGMVLHNHAARLNRAYGLGLGRRGSCLLRML